jgi:hypothetical protein
MSDIDLDAFLAGEALDHVVLFLTDDYLDDDALAAHGRAVDGGVILVVPGDQGRRLFQAGTGMDAMAFAREAMDVQGAIDRDLSGGTCPECGEDVAFVFAFAEGQNEEVGGIYAEGPVIHAYAACADGTAFSDRWVVGSDDG